MEKFLVAQIGARMNYAVPRLLNENEKLYNLYTDICSTKGYGALANYLPSGLKNKYLKKLLQRIPFGICNENIITFDTLGLIYFLKLRRAKSILEIRKAQLWAKSTFSQLVVKTGKLNTNVFTFNCAGLEIMREAKSKGYQAVMEQTIAPLELELALTKREAKKHPKWSPNIVENDKFTKKLIEREKKEWEEADKIICGSEFVKEGIRLCGGPYEKCVVVPYGITYDNLTFSNNKPLEAEKINILTVGTVELRKGIPYVLELAKKFKDKANFRIVGIYDHLPPGIIDELKEYIDLVGTVSRNEVRNHYEWANIFLFPSICEGSATVIYEAMAYGLPILTTKNSGSIIRDGVEGYVVDTEHMDELIEKFDLLISSKNLIEEFSKASFRRFNSFGHYRHYKERLLQALE